MSRRRDSRGKDPFQSPAIPRGKDLFQGLLIPLTDDLPVLSAGFVGYWWAIRCAPILRGCSEEEKRLFRVSAYLVCRERWSSPRASTRSLQIEDDLSPDQFQTCESSLRSDLNVVDFRKVGTLLLATKLSWFRCGDGCGRPLAKGIVRELAQELIRFDVRNVVAVRRHTDLVRALGLWVCTAGAMFKWTNFGTQPKCMSQNIPSFAVKPEEKSAFLSAVFVEAAVAHLQEAPPAGTAKLWNVAAAICEIERTPYADAIAGFKDEINGIKKEVAHVRLNPLSYHIMYKAVADRPRAPIRQPSQELVHVLAQFVHAIEADNLGKAKVFQVGTDVLSGELFGKITRDLARAKALDDATSGTQVEGASKAENPKESNTSDVSGTSKPFEAPEASAHVPSEDLCEGSTKSILKPPKKRGNW